MKKANNIIFNTIFWLLYFLYEWLSNGSLYDEYHRYFINACLLIPTAFITSYLSVHLLVKKFWFPKKKLAFWFGQILVALVFVIIRRGFNYYYTYPLYFPELLLIQSLFYPTKLLIEFVNLYLIISLYAMFYFVQVWYEQQKLVQTLQQEKMKAELDLLRLQVQPHFIFNTLNNIYAITVKKSPETANYLLKLASFLDYNLYDTKKDFVSLKDELLYIQNYIDLQKLRFGNKVVIYIQEYGMLDNWQIPPLLSLPLIENCFKHGVAEALDKSWINIEISAKEKELTLKVENSNEPEIATNKLKNSGMGLSNVKKRLALLYPENHLIKILDEKNSFMVVIKIKKIL